MYAIRYQANTAPHPRSGAAVPRNIDLSRCVRTVVLGALSSRLKPQALGDDAPRRWMEIAYEGQWAGYHRGKFEFTREHFAQMVENFDARKNWVVVHFGHPSPRARESGLPLPAAGWIRQLEMRKRDDGKWSLWVFLELTELAASMARKGELKYCSVVASTNSIDRESGDDIGAELHELGLLNDAFLDGMEPLPLELGTNPVALAAGKESVMKTDIEYLQAAIKKLGPEASMDRVIKLVAAMKNVDAAAEGKDGEGGDSGGSVEAGAKTVEAGATVQAGEGDAGGEGGEGGASDAAAGDAAAQVVGSIADAAGMSPDDVIAAMGEQVDAIATLLKGQPADGTAADAVAVMANKRAAKLQKSLAEEKAKTKALEVQLAAQRDAGALARIDAAIEAGRYDKEDRDDLLALSRVSPKVFEKEIGRSGGGGAEPPKGKGYQPAKASPGKPKTIQAGVKTRVAGAGEGAGEGDDTITTAELNKQISALGPMGKLQYNALRGAVACGAVPAAEALRVSQEADERDGDE